MSTRPLVFALLLSTLLPGGEVRAVVNPHFEDNHCNSCHLRLPAAGADGKMDYSFLAEEIDPTCMICHSQGCCSIAAPHQTTHASGIDKWDRQLFGRPEKLPLSDGFITCVTCHFWRRAINPAAQDYKLVRLVEISSRGKNWTGLCLDCHKKM